MCGGDIETQANQTYGTCSHCGNIITLPKVNDEQIANIFNRANHYRRQNDFDKAIQSYENIVNLNGSSAEAHWGLVLSKYGIEYVVDPTSGERIPTCHRMQNESILSNVDYSITLEKAEDNYTRNLYKTEANRIAELQKNILSISNKEAPCDIFICYKETAENGSRTSDSIIAQDLYFALKNEGYHVFFSRVTLEDKLGAQYEPYIFAALNSAKIMLVIGTKQEYFNATWVKNEWSRFLSLTKHDKSRVVIPCYRDMDVYDIPDELSVLQSLDMSKIGFAQDLIRGIHKIMNTSKNANANTNIAMAVPGVTQLLDRVEIFLEDGDFIQAREYINKILDLEPKNAKAYFQQMLMNLSLKQEEDLFALHTSLDRNSDYQKSLRFADAAFKQKLEDYNQRIKSNIENARLEKLYQDAIADMKNLNTTYGFQKVISQFTEIIDYKDAREKIEEVQAKLKIKNDTDAQNKAKKLEAEAHDKAEKLETKYQRILTSITNAKSINTYEYLVNELEKLGEYKDSSELMKKWTYKLSIMKRRRKIITVILSAAACIALLIFTLSVFANIHRFSETANDRNSFINKHDFITPKQLQTFLLNQNHSYSNVQRAINGMGDEYWYISASEYANNILINNFINENNLFSLLYNEGFTESQAQHAIDSINWYYEAEKQVAILLFNNNASKSTLIRDLLDKGFNETQAIHDSEINMFNLVTHYARMLMNEDNYTFLELKEALLLLGFNKNQANYGAAITIGYTDMTSIILPALPLNNIILSNIIESLPSLESLSINNAYIVLINLMMLNVTMMRQDRMEIGSDEWELLWLENRLSSAPINQIVRKIIYDLADSTSGTPIDQLIQELQVIHHSIVNWRLVNPTNFKNGVEIFDQLFENFMVLHEKIVNDSFIQDFINGDN